MCIYPYHLSFINKYVLMTQFIKLNQRKGKENMLKMKPFKLSYCPAEKKPCIRWIEEVLKDCLCNINDEISFGFGVLSLIFWAVAEIPQIVTNFSNKSGNGVSLAFLSTWILGYVNSLNLYRSLTKIFMLSFFSYHILYVQCDYINMYTSN